MGRKIVEYPKCNHSGDRDCFACSMKCDCFLLTETDFISKNHEGICPFYKSRYEVMHHEDKRRNRIQKSA